MPGKKREGKYHIAGWALFVLCACLFLYSAVRDGDGVLFMASLVFLFGCVLFLVPLLFPHKEAGRARQSDDVNLPVDGS